jgi:hypothetical protein
LSFRSVGGFDVPELPLVPPLEALALLLAADWLAVTEVEVPALEIIDAM